jgi:hypothetical protein
MDTQTAEQILDLLKRRFSSNGSEIPGDLKAFIVRSERGRLIRVINCAVSPREKSHPDLPLNSDSANSLGLFETKSTRSHVTRAKGDRGRIGPAG